MTIARARPTTAAAGSLLTDVGLGSDGFLELVDLAADLKTADAEGREVPRLSGKKIALVFEKASTQVFTLPASVVFQQAENRMHTIKALLVSSLAA